MHAGGLGRNPRRKSKLAGGQRTAIEKRREDHAACTLPTLVPRNIDRELTNPRVTWSRAVWKRRGEGGDALSAPATTISVPGLNHSSISPDVRVSVSKVAMRSAIPSL
jgi:hypothetical protein